MHSNRSATPIRPSASTTIPEIASCGVAPFDQTLEAHGIDSIRPNGIRILQVNVGRLCNLRCTHCHVDAGPDRREVMGRQVMGSCLDVLRSTASITTLDITGGAPEMNPDFRWFIEEARKARTDIDIMVRSNLTLLDGAPAYRDIPHLLRDNRINLIASLPCFGRDNVDKVRGTGVFDRSISALRLLNDIGYGTEGSPLELSLVYNEAGASLPPCQQSLEKEYRSHLKEAFGISFTRLLTITNMPVGRFLENLLESGSYCAYMQLLASSFNPSAVGPLMCRDTISVSWDGRLFDCDFNQMLGLQPDASAPSRIGEFDEARLLARRISTGNHCYGCTAGAGSSCHGSLV